MPARRSHKASLTTRSRRILGAVLLILFAWAAPADAITYVYDELGRLVGVIDPSQGTAVYTYDAVGNILSIQRYAASAVLIIEFTPNSGAVNATVTLYGTGYSATPSQNTVTFNGVAATVTSSTATSIVTKVPAGATTGPVAVTTPTGSATSSTSFVVTAAIGAPTITSFTPTIGTPGTAVTVTGTNFDTTPANDKLAFNTTVRQAIVSGATSTQLSTSVPSQVGSGHLKVTTLTGSGTSSGDFFVPPPDYAASDVVFTSRMTYGGATKTVTIGTPYKIAEVTLDVTAGQALWFQTSSITLSQAQVNVQKPDNTPLGAYALPVDSTLLNFGYVPVTGTYTLVMYPPPNSSATGSVTFKAGAPDFTVTALTIPTSPISPNKSGIYSFTLSYTVKNQGTIDVGRSWWDRMYLSTNNIWESGDPQVGALFFNTYLTGGSTYSQNNVGINTSATFASGDYYVIVYTDSDGQILESSESNNTRVSATKLTLLGRPDLVPTGLTVPATPVAPNQNGTYSVPVSYTVANQGASTAIQNWLDLVYLSADTVLDGGDLQFTGQWQNTDVAAGTNYMQSMTGTIPNTTAPGDYYLILKVDGPSSQVAESNENNNILASATRFTLLGRPDLVPTVLTIPTNPVVRNGDGTWSVPVSYTVANQGATTAIQNWLDLVYLSADTVLDGGDLQFTGQWQNTDVAAGTNYMQSMTGTIPSTTAPGDYYIILKVDGGYPSVAEANENNNLLVSATRVTLLP